MNPSYRTSVQVSKCAVPLSVGVKRYQTDVMGSWSGCAGSPTSPVAFTGAADRSAWTRQRDCVYEVVVRGRRRWRRRWRRRRRRRRRRWWRPGAVQRRHPGAAPARPRRDRRRAAVDLEIPDHRVRHAVVEPEPGRRRGGDVVRVVHAPVRPGEDLSRDVVVRDDRVHRDVRQVARLVEPRGRAAVRRAGHLEDVPRRRRRVRVEPADSRVADREIARAASRRRGRCPAPADSEAPRYRR